MALLNFRVLIFNLMELANLIFFKFGACANIESIILHMTEYSQRDFFRVIVILFRVRE